MMAVALKGLEATAADSPAARRLAKANGLGGGIKPHDIRT
jgi:hypothetical protein